MSDRLTNVWVWHPSPGFEWRCYEGISGTVVDAGTRVEAVALFTELWANRSPLRWIDEAPPPPKRPGESKPVSAAIEGDTIAAKFHRSMLRAFHVDLHGTKKRWSADQIVAIINEKWTEASGK
jgi:hypothetical protein